MYTYKISYHTPEGGCETEFSHKKQFTEEELTGVIGAATVEAIKRIRAKRGKNAYVHSFEGIYRDVMGVLEERGFVFIEREYVVDWTTFGWASVFKREGWETYRDEHNDAIADAVSGAGLKPGKDGD